MNVNNLDIQYQKLLLDIIHNGVEKKDRTGTGTISVFGRQIRHKMSDGFPLLTTKKMAWKSIVVELLWFLRGDTNIKFLVDNDCNIWNGDAYKNYVKYCQSEQLTDYDDIDGFIKSIKNYDEFAKKYGELGTIYGKQWRNWEQIIKVPAINNVWGTGFEYSNIHIDQIANLINELRTNPDSRRLMVSAWNVGELDSMVLPPCHYGFQVYTRELSENERINLCLELRPESKFAAHVETNEILMDDWNIPKRAISLMWNQRSVDTFLGLPFNIASYGLLLEIIAKETNMVPDELIGNLGDVHLYSNHKEQAVEQMSRTPYQLPTLKHMKTDAFYKSLSEESSLYGHLDPKDFQLEGYQSHPAIKAPLSN